MKTSENNQYAYTNNLLMSIVSAVLGYNLYQAIVHPENSHLFLSLILVAITYYVLRQNDSKANK